MLDRDLITQAFARLSELLAQRGVQGEICVLGGAAMVLAFDARPSTKDVDAIFEPATVIRELSTIVASELGLPEDWLNDAAKGFASGHHVAEIGDLPQFDALRVLAPPAEYLLAMKCMASRMAVGAGGADDVRDIRFLLQRLEIRDVAQALDIVARYYPAGRIPVRAQFLLEELLATDGGAP